MSKVSRFTLVEYKMDNGVVYKMRLNKRELDLYNLLSSNIGAVFSFEEMEQKIGINPNLARVTKYSLAPKLPFGLELLTVYGKGYFLSKSEGADGED